MCAVLQHEVQLEVELELTAAREQDGWRSAQHELPAAADSPTRWRVRFEHNSGEMRVRLECTSLDEQQFNVTAVRVSMVVNSDPSNSVDATARLPRGDYCWSQFAKPLAEWGDASPTRVLVRVRWTHVVSLCL